MKTTAEPTDTILEEIHETRRRLLQEHGGVHGLAEFLREQEAKGDRGTVCAEPGPPDREPPRVNRAPP